MFIKDWEKAVEALSKKDLEKYAGAIDILLAWPVFKLGYEHAKLKMLRDVLRHEAKGRVNLKDISDPVIAEALGNFPEGKSIL